MARRSRREYGADLEFQPVQPKPIGIDPTAVPPRVAQAQERRRTVGVLTDYEGSFVVDPEAQLLRVTDRQATPEIRINLGKLGAGVTDYGIEVFDSSGNTIFSVSGLGPNTVGNLQLKDNAVDTLELAALAVTGAKIDNVTIAGGKLIANTITAAQIFGNTITAAEIAANTITASEIVAGTITGTEITGTTLSGIFVNAGTITAGLLQNQAGTVFMDLDAVGAGAFIQHPNFTLLADGTATFSGSLTAGDVLVNGTVTVNGPNIWDINHSLAIESTFNVTTTNNFTAAYIALGPTGEFSSGDSLQLNALTLDRFAGIILSAVTVNATAGSKSVTEFGGIRLTGPIIGTNTPTITNNIGIELVTGTAGTNNWSVKADRDVQTARQFISTLATGTSPLTVSSTTVVTNLNADLLDGLQGAAYALSASPTITGIATMGTITIDDGGVVTDVAGVVVSTSAPVAEDNVKGTIWCKV